MKILDVYEKYEITPLLQLHQLRAASVGEYITKHWNKKKEIDKDAVIQTLLLHDMGNIIKFDLTNTSKLLGDEMKNIGHWRNIQKKFIEKYGTNEHEATYEIGKEIGVNKTVENLLSQLKSTQNAAEGNDFNLKICFYSDLRSAPFGVVNVNKRFDDLIERYKGRDHPIADLERTENNRKYTHYIENQLQKFVSFDLESISGEKIAKNMEDLKTYNLPILNS